MGTITINGKRITVSGNNISAINGTVFVDGKKIEGDALQGEVKIAWEGPLASLKADCEITCGEVQGNVHAGNGVHCGNVRGNVTAGNSIHCGDVQGDVHAGNSVRRK